MRDERNHFIIDKCRTNYRIRNRVKEKMRYEFNHTHLPKWKYNYKSCEELIDMVLDGKIPQDSYLRESAYRLSRKENYRQAILFKIDKDLQKPKYVNKPVALR